MNPSRLFPILSVISFLAVWTSALGATIEKTPAPTWVETLPFEVPSEPLPKSVSDGVYYLLSNHQYNVPASRRYYRGATHFTNETGVEEHSTITIEFDPSYETLQLHRLIIHRDGRQLDRLESQVFETLTSDTSNESLLYDKNVQAHAILDDIQIGDTLEYAYSIGGRNPVMDDHFDWSFRTNWAVHLRETDVRVIWNSATPLFHKTFNTDLTVLEAQKGELTEYRWRALSVDPVITDSHLPSWYNPWGVIRMTSFESWQDVAEWGQKLYSYDEPLPKLLQDEVERISAISDPAEQVMEALRFVQAKIRYTGIASGIHNYAPYPLDAVCERRYGDCKDKSRVLTVMLRSLGFDAYPALVETDYGKVLDSELPAPSRFDHAVTVLNLRDETFWLDATRIPQYGQLGDVYFPDYGYGLILSPNTSGLTKIGSRGHAQSKTTVSDVYKELPDNKAEFNVTTRYHGNEADRARDHFKSQNVNELQQDYLNFYAKYFPKIASNKEVRFSDDQSANRFTVVESYRINEFFSPRNDPDDGKIYAEFYTSFISDNYTIPTTRIRSMPFYQEFPNRMEHRLEINFAENIWDLGAVDETVENDTFRFSAKTTPSKQKVVLDFEFQTKRDHTPADETDNYISDTDRVHDLLFYQLYQTVDDNLASPASSITNDANSTLNTPIIILMGFLFVITAPITILFAAKQKKLDPAPETLSDSLHGLSGWLILPAIGLCLSPLTLGYTLVDTFVLLDLENWLSVTTPGNESYHPLWAVAIYFELAANVVLFELYSAAVFLFFSKKRIFPKLYVTLLLLTTGSHIISLALVINIPNYDEAIYTENTTEMAKSILRSAIWIPYMLVSDRVKRTFVY